jgi:hypothetical protein
VPYAQNCHDLIWWRQPGAPSVTAYQQQASSGASPSRKGRGFIQEGSNRPTTVHLRASGEHAATATPKPDGSSSAGSLGATPLSARVKLVDTFGPAIKLPRCCFNCRVSTSGLSPREADVYRNSPVQHGGARSGALCEWRHAQPGFPHAKPAICTTVARIQ